MTPRRRFGHLRKLPSGRWHASFVGRDGKRITAPQTFVTKTDASRWLAAVELSPDVAVASTKGIRIPLLEYTQTWLDENPRIGPRWRETCQRNLRLHLADLHSTPVAALTPSQIREWHAKASQRGGRTSVAQSY